MKKGYFVPTVELIALSANEDMLTISIQDEGGADIDFDMKPKSL